MLRYIAIIKVAQRWHTLDEIRAALGELPPDSKLTAAQWKSLSARWRQTLDERIKRLTRLRDELDNCIGCGCLSLQDCPLRNPNDALAAEGPGPRIRASVIGGRRHVPARLAAVPFRGDAALAANRHGQARSSALGQGGRPSGRRMARRDRSRIRLERSSMPAIR